MFRGDRRSDLIELVGGLAVTSMPFRKEQAHSLCRPPIRKKNECFLMVTAHDMCLIPSFVERYWR